jgi:hypothetical protein
MLTAGKCLTLDLKEAKMQKNAKKNWQMLLSLNVRTFFGDCNLKYLQINLETPESNRRKCVRIEFLSDAKLLITKEDPVIR